MSGPIELEDGAIVRVTPPVLPMVAAAPPATEAVAVLPVVGPPGAQGPPGEDADDRLLAYAWEQVTPSTVWLVDHPLDFRPSGVVVLDHLGHRQYPRVSWPTTGQVRLDFDRDVRGTAHLS